MTPMNSKRTITMKRLLPVVIFALALSFTATAYAAAPGIKETKFALTASPNYISQPDGQMIYSWGYGCTTSGTGHTFAPVMSSATCPAMQIPGPTLIVTEGAQFTVTLTNALPAAAGNTSILFPGLRLVSAVGGAAGVLTQEATATSPVVYTLVADSPGTRAYYSGSQSDLQVEMGLYGAVVALPNGGLTSGACPTHNTAA